MSIEKRVRDALLPIVPVVEPLRYDGDALTYITFSYDELGEVYAEGQAQELRYLLSVRLHMPLRPTQGGESVNPRAYKRQIRAALSAAGCTTPNVTDASDDAGQLYVFECEAVDDGTA